MAGDLFATSKNIWKLSPAKFDAIIAEKIRKLSVVFEKNQDFSENEKNSKQLPNVVHQYQNGLDVDSVVENSVWVSAKMLTAT